MTKLMGIIKSENKLTGSLGVRNEINVDIIGTGARGKEGKSAYEIWLDIGNEGTEQEYLASLKGQDGYTPIKGVDYFDGEKGDTGEPGTSSNLVVNKQYESYEDLPISEDIGYMCLVGFELHIFTEDGWVNAGKLTEIDYDIFVNIDGGLFTDDGGVVIGESGLEALRNHIIDANTHDNLIIDGMEV